MEFFVIAAIALLIGSLFGWISFFRVKNLEAQITKLTNELNVLRRSLLNKPETPPQPTSLQTPPDETPQPKPLEVNQPVVTSSVVEENDAPVDGKQPEPIQTQEDAVEPTTPEVETDPVDTVRQPILIDTLFDKFKDNWMLWMGGLSLALAGVFLARYAIQHGILGPIGRIISGMVTGISLHIAAEYLRRRTGESHNRKCVAIVQHR